MANIRVNGSFADGDLSLLRRHLHLLDLELVPLCAAIKLSGDPDGAGLCDSAEYFIGHGFVAAQRYLTATRSGIGASAADAFSCAPMARADLSVAAAINAGANYWKHMEEWFGTPGKPAGELKGPAIKTLQQIEIITPWADYTCSNLLASLLGGRSLELSLLLPAIELWRDNLHAMRENSGSNSLQNRPVVLSP